MRFRRASARLAVVPFLIAAIFFNTNEAAAQGALIPISDITGGSGIFVMRGGGGPRQFVSRVKAKPTRTQRIEVAKRVSKQYVTLAKVAPRRTRTNTVNPDDPRLKDIKRMSKEDASKLFAGVGEYHMDRDDYNQAIDLFREALTMDATNKAAATGLSEALALKGNELLVKDSFPVAKTFFEEALKYNPKNAPAYFGLAEVLTEMSDQAEASDPEKARQQSAEAVANYEKALQNDKELSEIYTPLGTLYYRAGEIAKADEKLTLAVAASPNDPQANFYLGLVRLAQQNRDAEALTLLQKAAKLDATNPEVFFYLGETLTRMNRYKEAAVEYNKAVQLRDNYFEAWLNLGAAEFRDGNHQKAVDAYFKATRLNNASYIAHNNLADAYREVGNFNQAESSYNLAAVTLQRQPDHSKEEVAEILNKAAFSVAKQCELNLKMKPPLPCRWNMAIDYLEKANALNAGGVDAANLGWAYYNAARADQAYGRTAEVRPKLEKAKLNLQKAAATNSDFVAGPMLNLGMALTDLGEYPAAVDVLKKVIEKEPKWVFAINELGMAYFKQGNYKDAADQFKKATDKDGKFAIGYYNLAFAQFKNGNLGEARKNWDVLKKMGRNDLAARLDVETNGGLRARS